MPMYYTVFIIGKDGVHLTFDGIQLRVVAVLLVLGHTDTSLKDGELHGVKR